MITVKGVRLFQTTSNGQEVTDLFYIVDGVIVHRQVRPSKLVHEIEALLKHGYTSRDGVSRNVNDPVLFLAGLQARYSGVYFRATAIEEIPLSEIS